MDIADAIGEPLGRSAGHLWLDEQNVHWTGHDLERAWPGRCVGR
jgi:hypothetical protein